MGTYMSEFIGAGDWRLAFIHRDRIESTTVEQVNAAVQKYFIPTNRTIGNFIPTDKPERVEILHTEVYLKWQQVIKVEWRWMQVKILMWPMIIFKTIDSGMLPKSGIEYGLLIKLIAAKL